jgi:hypothetical protein
VGEKSGVFVVIKAQKWPWFGWKYPLVNIQKTMEHHHVQYCLMGQFTISMAMFNSKLLNYQRVTMI